MESSHKKCSVIFSRSAYNGIIAETYERVGTETGGILLGKYSKGQWFILETVDPGPNSIFTPTYFEYDTPYVNHLSNKIERFYKNGLELVGLWHRHPGNFSTFSSTDDTTNIKYASQNVRGAISALVNLVPDFKLTVYHVSIPLRYTRVDFIVDDNKIPEILTERKEYSDFVLERGRRTNVQNPIDLGLRSMIDSEKSKSLFRLPAFFSQLISPREHSPRHKDVSESNRPVDNEQLQDNKFPEPSNVGKETVLDMIENELVYLESQFDYNYSLKLIGDEVAIELIYTQKMPYYPKNLRIIFGITTEGVGYVEIDGKKYKYSRQFIRNHINRSINFG